MKGSFLNNFRKIANAEPLSNLLLSLMTRSSDDSPGCLSSSCACFFVLAALGGSVCLFVFTIKGLVQDWDLAKDCNESSLHIYLIVALVLAHVSGASASNGARCEDFWVKMCAMIFSTLLSAAMAAWGYVEVFDRACPDLEHTLMWDMGIVVASLHAFVILYTLVVGGLVLCLVCS
jgi:hypothetical protein